MLKVGISCIKARLSWHLASYLIFRTFRCNVRRTLTAAAKFKWYILRLPPPHSSPSDFSEIKGKNNTRRCVPTCLPEYSAIIANSRILQPLQPAAAPKPQVALTGFFMEIQGGVSGFSVSHRCRDKGQLFQPFRKKPHWDVGCGNRLCNFLPSEIKNAYQTIRSWRSCEDTSVGWVDALFPDTMLSSIHLRRHSQWNI